MYNTNMYDLRCAENIAYQPNAEQNAIYIYIG